MSFELLSHEKKLDPDKLTAVIDLDFVKYSSASVGDRRFIKVKNKRTGKSKEFEGRTEFWGRKGNGGLFLKMNEKLIEKGKEPYTIDDFEIEDLVEATEPLENILHTAKVMVDSAIKMSGAEQYVGYYGVGSPDRVGISTLLEYKGKRGAPKPTYLQEVTDYLAYKFDGIPVEGIEADDKVVMEAYGKDNFFVLGVDKDYRGSGSKFFDVNSPEEGIIDTSGLGALWEKPNGKISGKGLLFKLWQVCSEDSVDNYKASCFSDKKWGAKSAYKSLKDATTEKEAYEAAIGVFKKLYPEPKNIKGWRGDTIDIDWLYVMQEMYTLAHMQRWENDVVDLVELFEELGCDY